MQMFQKEQCGLIADRRVRLVEVEDITPNPSQPRRIFDQEPLQELAESIKLYGVLSPLCVRHTFAGYELIAGERRLRAAKLAGLTKVPCTVLDVDEKGSELIALVENLQRQDLDYIEEAEGISRLMERYGFSQEEAARAIGKSQSAVANKLRLLRHPPEVLMLLAQYRLTERHARALLRIQDLQQRVEALHHIGKKRLNVAQAEKYIDELLSGKVKKKPVVVVKDVRLFLNTLERALSTMRHAGISANMKREEQGDEILVTIRIPK